MAAVAHQIKEDRISSRNFLNQRYATTGTPERERLQYLKQTIHVDLKSHLDVWGSKFLERILSMPEYGGYVRINKRLNSESKVDPTNYIDPSIDRKDYKNMIVLDGAINNVKHRKSLDAAMAYFNNSADGKDCMLLINTWRFREGISLRGVYSTHVVGYLTSRAYLIQAAYRGIRNCSHRLVPYDKGWDVKIHMYTPTFANSDLTGMKLYQLMDKSTAVNKALETEMDRLVKDTAFDALLLKAINDQSEEVFNRFQLAPTLKDPHPPPLPSPPSPPSPYW
jgi:hypothetical protein